MHQNNSYSHPQPHENQNNRPPNFRPLLQDKIFHCILHIGRLNGQPISSFELNKCLQYFYGERIRGDNHPIFRDLHFRYLIRTNKSKGIDQSANKRIWNSQFQLNIQIEDVCRLGTFCENRKCRNLHFISKGVVYSLFHHCVFANGSPLCRESSHLPHTYEKQVHLHPQVIVCLYIPSFFFDKRESRARWKGKKCGPYCEKTKKDIFIF